MPDEGAVLDAVVVGAGQAGLGVSYYLARAGVRHRVLERGRIGESWRSQRWDAFRMNTVNAMTVMPGQRYEGPDPEGFMSQHGWVGLLEDFAARNRLPVEAGTPVMDLALPRARPGLSLVHAARGDPRAGAWSSRAAPHPPAPAAVGGLPAGRPGPRSTRPTTGTPPASRRARCWSSAPGHSGCQIAEDLLDAGRDRLPRHLPRGPPAAPLPRARHHRLGPRHRLRGRADGGPGGPLRPHPRTAAGLARPHGQPAVAERAGGGPARPVRRRGGAASASRTTWRRTSPSPTGPPRPRRGGSTPTSSGWACMPRRRRTTRPRPSPRACPTRRSCRLTPPRAASRR